MLRLPPAIRSAVASRSLTGATQSLVRFDRARWTGAALARLQSILQQATPWRSTYATVQADGLDRMWREHGNEAPKKSGSNRLTNTQGLQSPPSSARADLNAALQDRLSSLELAKAQELIITLHELAKARNGSDARRVARRKIREAVYSDDPLSSLRRRAKVVMAGREKGTTKKAKSAESTKGPSADELHNSEVDTSEITGPGEFQLLDVQSIQRTMSLPTKEQYPFALDELFDHTQIAAAIHNQCQRRKLSQQSDLDFKTKKGLSKEMLRRLSPNGRKVVV